ncbi:MAG: aminodeoxychorismate synthase component I, partial [Pseudomonadota bacterium]
MRSGGWAAGLFAYSLGAALEPRLTPLLAFGGDRTPLMTVGLFGPPTWLDGPGRAAFLGAGPFEITAPQATLSPDQYKEIFDACQAYLEAGDVYQLNLTFPLAFEAFGSMRALYRALHAAQPAAHAAYVETATTAVLSLSPELFFSVNEGQIISRPMKGTLPRDPSENPAKAASRLRADPKQQAENLMITDLIRNDLSRISKVGSVDATLFSVEALPTLWQMTSEVRGELKAGTPPSHILNSLFPCGSITGAPKIRAMELITALEGRDRGLYTGSIGWFGPSGDACLSVAIRTVEVDGPPERGGPARLGVGSGVVSDSTATSEYQECLIKAAFIEGAATRAHPMDVSLIETMRWEPARGIALLDRHLERMAGSAGSLGFAFDREALVRDIERHCDRLASEADPSPHKVRLVLAQTGALSLTAEPLKAIDAPLRLALSPRRVFSGDPYLGHKTSRRFLYTDGFATM